MDANFVERLTPDFALAEAAALRAGVDVGALAVRLNMESLGWTGVRWVARFILNVARRQLAIELHDALGISRDAAVCEAACRLGLSPETALRDERRDRLAARTAARERTKRAADSAGESALTTRRSAA